MSNITNNTKKPKSLRGNFLNNISKNSVTSVATSALICTALSAVIPSNVLAENSNSKNTKKSVELSTVTVVGKKVKGLINPYSNINTPYKVDRLASGKYTEEILNTPKTIKVVPKEVIKDSGATTFKEVMKTQSGVTLGTGEGGNAFGDRIIIRGFEARNDVYIDGLRDPGVSLRETFATEQIEIVKGPNSTYGGRGTTGGSVDIVSKKPLNETASEVETKFGTDQTRRFTVDTNQVINDKFAIRFNGLTHNANVAGRDEVFDRREGAAIATTINPNDELKIDFDYYHYVTDFLPDWGVPFNTGTQRPLKVDRNNFYGLLDRDFQLSTADIVTNKVQYYFDNDSALSNQMRYGSTINKYVASAPQSANIGANTVSASAKTRDQENEYFANQTNFLKKFETGKLKHSLVTGAEFSREGITNNSLTVSPSSVTQNLFNPSPYGWTGTVRDGAGFVDTVVVNKALYVVDTLKLNEQWQLTGGIRYDDYKIKLLNEASGFKGMNDEGFFNWQGSINYKPQENGSIYASVSTSSNPSGEQVDGNGDTYGGLSAGNQNLEPEQNTSYEVGTKWDLFENNLNTTLALFQIDKRNARVATGGGVVVLDGEQRVQGVEVGAGGNITDKLSTVFSFTYLDTEITSSPLAAQVDTEFPNVAEKSMSWQTKYKLTKDLSIGGLLYYSDDKNGGTVNAGTSLIPSYWRLDLMSEYQLTEKASIKLNILNATDVEYYDTIYRSANPFAYIAPGRAAYITLGYKF